jgi:hypothetical protein
MAAAGTAIVFSDWPVSCWTFCQRQTWHKAMDVQHLGQLAFRELQMQVVDATVLALFLDSWPATDNAVRHYCQLTLLVHSGTVD